jgi:hypothetical protein
LPESQNFKLHFKINFALLTILPLISQSQAQVKIAGHGSGYYFEDSESSLQLMGFIEKQFGRDTFMAEVDLRMSKSAAIYMMHDETVDRTTAQKSYY